MQVVYLSDYLVSGKSFYMLLLVFYSDNFTSLLLVGIRRRVLGKVSCKFVSSDALLAKEGKLQKKRVFFSSLLKMF